MMSDRKERADMKKINQKQFNNNDYLTRLNMSDAPRDVRMQWLCKIIDNEMAKNVDEIDMELVNECQEELAELMAEERTERFAGQDASTSAESEYAGNLSSRGRVEFIKARNDEKAHMAQSHQVNRRFPKRLAVAAAAALIICSAAVTVFVAAEGFGSMEEFVSYISLKLKPGERADQNGITFINNGKSINYDSVEEFASKENLDVFYPAELPEGVFIKKIILTGDLKEENDCTLVYVFTDSNIALLINNYSSIHISTDNYQIFDSTLGKFYVKEINGHYQAVCQTEKYEYCIDTNDIESLQIIMKGLQQP